MKAHFKKTSRGFALIEALVAMLILGFGMLAVAGFQTTLSLNSDVAKQRTEATRLAQQKLEQLRSFSTLAIYGTSMASSTTGTPGTPGVQETITTNTSFTRTWGITPASTVDTGRSAVVTVAWTDRAGGAQQVQLFSFISATSPILNGSLFFPLPDGSIIRRPKNRNIDIPIPAVSITGTDKSYIRWSGSSGGYLIFSNTNGDIVKKCTALPTADNIITSNCVIFDGYLLTGYITGNNATNLNLVTQIVVPFGSPQYISGTPECQVGTAYDQNDGTTPIPDTKYYACLVQPTDHDSNASTARVWSGRVDLAGATDASLAGTYTCRFTTDASTTVNNNHPAVYSLVDRSLDNQNFYISSSSCADTSLFRVAHLTNTGTTPQFSVTYVVNIGTGTVPTDATAYTSGSTVTVLASPSLTRSGFTFGGWSLTSTGAAVTSFNITANTTLYAQWTQIQFGTPEPYWTSTTSSTMLPLQWSNIASATSYTVLSCDLTGNDSTCTPTASVQTGNSNSYTPAAYSGNVKGRCYSVIATTVVGVNSAAISTNSAASSTKCVQSVQNSYSFN